MTINVVVATFDAIVLGCDSLSSVAEQAFFPFRHGSQFAVDTEGNALRDSTGNLLIPYNHDQLSLTATNVMGGVRKMFLLHQDATDEPECSVAAVTSGLAVLNGSTIAEVGNRYRRQIAITDTQCLTAQEVADSFLAYVRPLWEQQVDFAGTEEAMRQGLPNLNFMVAGYGSSDSYIPVFRVNVAENTCTECFPTGDHCSAAWDGQSNSVARLINGWDGRLQYQVNRSIVEALHSQRESIVQSVLDQLRSQSIQIPEEFEMTLEEVLPPSAPWSQSGAIIDWRNLPVQSAIELVSALVNTESGMQKFAHGIPMVGGRTRIGLIRRNVPFESLNEPALAHAHVGYAADA